jgi:hypothetical protein
MKERIQSGTRTIARNEEEHTRLRPVDGFVVGGDAAWESGENLWLLLSRPGERLIDFFLEEDELDRSLDPIPYACAGVSADGTVLIAEVDWELDRFLSEMLDEKETAAAR